MKRDVGMVCHKVHKQGRDGKKIQSLIHPYIFHKRAVGKGLCTTIFPRFYPVYIRGGKHRIKPETVEV